MKNALRADVSEIVAILRAVGRPCTWTDIQQHAPRFDRELLRNRLGHASRRGWVRCHRVLNGRNQYIPGCEMREMPAPFMPGHEEPPQVHAERLRRVAARFEREAEALQFEDVAEARMAAQAARDLADEWQRFGAVEVA